MARRPQFYFLPSYGFPDASNVDSLLGSIAKNFMNPLGPRFPDPRDVSWSVPKACHETEVSQLEVSAVALRPNEYAGGLQQVLGASIALSEKRVLNISHAEQLRYLRLDDEDKVFTSLTQRPEFPDQTGKWFKSRLSSASACMIVGLLVCQDAMIQDIKGTNKKFHIAGTIPVVTAATAEFTGLPISIGDPHVSFTTAAERSSALKGFHKASKIIGLEYLWIHRNPLRKGPSMANRGPATKLQLSGSDDDIDSDEEDENDSEMDSSQLRLAEASESWLNSLGIAGVTE